jgi:hypothetical protein
MTRPMSGPIRSRIGSTYIIICHDGLVDGGRWTSMIPCGVDGTNGGYTCSQRNQTSHILGGFPWPIYTINRTSIPYHIPPKRSIQQQTVSLWPLPARPSRFTSESHYPGVDTSLAIMSLPLNLVNLRLPHSVLYIAFGVKTPSVRAHAQAHPLHRSS